MNKVFISGNLGANPEVKDTKSGTKVVNLSVATNERNRQPDGTYKDHTEWHQVVVFGKQAETCGKFLTKGSKVIVEGKLRTRKYTTRDNQERTAREIIADRVEFISRAGSPTDQVNSHPASSYDEIPF
jgi:single-strand DNA-binding protein